MSSTIRSKNAFYDVDAKAREALSRFARLATRSKQLKRQPGWSDSMTMEPTHPALVGIDQEPSDAFTPEELVRMFNRKPLTVNWDRQHNYNT